MSDTLKIRRFDRLSTGTVRAKAQFRLRRELSRTIRPSLTPALRLGLTRLPPTRLITPALRLGLVGTRHTGALALMAQQHEVVHVIYCQSLTERSGSCVLRDLSSFPEVVFFLPQWVLTPYCIKRLMCSWVIKGHSIPVPLKSLFVFVKSK